ncbi:MAG: hypothetical protein EOO03_13175 [Chitinophagaceae bacterium]|nr:MAG: hypothetical protein EOO03_13175 [Chitinophagaceae bacterium]
MQQLKRWMGVVWMLMAPIFMYLLIAGAAENISSTGTKDIQNPVPWFIIIGIFTPIAIGLIIFGYYAFKGEYDTLPENSAGL